MRNIPLLKLATEFSQITKGSVFKCRAEGRVDVEAFLRICKKSGVKISDVKIEPQFLVHEGRKIAIPDVELVFSSDEKLETIKHVLALIPDGHVMLETLTHGSHYTGERSYKRPAQLD